MRHRTVRDVMTRQVVRVAPATCFHEILTLLTEFDITAVPVVDDADRPVGIVSEADLMRTQAAQEDPSSPLPPTPAQAGGPDRTGADTAQALMTSPAVCSTPSASVVAAARSMARHHIKPLPVVDGDGRLAGMVSRSDLIQVFLRDDQVIRHDIVQGVLGQVEGVSPAAIGVEVAQGRVVLSGTIEPRRLVPIVLRLCRSVDGVVSVTDRTDRPRSDCPCGGVCALIRWCGPGRLLVRMPADWVRSTLERGRGRLTWPLHDMRCRRSSAAPGSPRRVRGRYSRWPCPSTR
ncbi:inosine-5'-monophosphate dehydrogenase [Streptomyces tateyamensis]|uniref:Inosine-5'-monophosphate dehydrogenase n=1 Tax=Streptomyces tateyamensis TaxID=565073 RepID=A0A2V4NZL7_9ACTN|nr:inosine-5'-monophosphate dehydrogenase [Streptomyces tateyamensis]